MVCVCLQEVLVEQRTVLSDMLQQLLKQRDQREKELQQVLVRRFTLIFHVYLKVNIQILIRMA